MDQEMIMFGKCINEYLSNIDDLVDFTEHLGGYLIKHDQEDRITSELVNEYRSIYQKLKGDIQSSQKEKIDLQNRLNQINDEISKMHGFTTQIRLVKRIRNNKGIKGTITIPSLFVNGKIHNSDYHSYDTQIMQGRCDRLYVSTFINLISATEWFMFQLLHTYYDKYPKSACVEDNKLRCSDLRKLNSIEDAINCLVDMKIEAILRQSVDNWIRQLKQELKLSLKYVSKTMPLIVEMYQRRNLLIHNGGIINSLYINLVKPSQRQGKKSGDRILVDKNYLYKALVEVRFAFLMIAFELWMTQRQQSITSSIWIFDFALDYASNNYYPYVITICQLVRDKKGVEVLFKKKAQLLMLWCNKQLNGIGSIAGDIPDESFCDDDPELLLYLMALRDNFLEMNNILLNKADILDFDTLYLRQHPILRDYIRSEEFANISQRINE